MKTFRLRYSFLFQKVFQSVITIFTCVFTQKYSLKKAHMSKSPTLTAQNNYFGYFS